MIRVIEQQSIAKSTTTPSEDAVVVTAYYAAVIDGATPKTAFRYPSGETPGQMAARILSEAIAGLPIDASAPEATHLLTAALHQDGAAPANRPTASCVIYSAWRNEVWMLGDCHFATRQADATWRHYTNEKRIDHQLADWRRAVICSYLSRGILTEAQILADDPGRRIIQPQITRQVRFQNLTTGHPLAYCMLDGEPIDPMLIRIFPLGNEISQLILASDGYPELLPTLDATEDRLQQLLREDALCIGPLLGTKGIRPGNRSYDDRTYLRIQLEGQESSPITPLKQ